MFCTAEQDSDIFTLPTPSESLTISGFPYSYWDIPTAGYIQAVDVEVTG